MRRSRMSTPKPLKNVTVYIDGFNFYHALDSLIKINAARIPPISNNYIKWMSYVKLAESFISQDERLRAVYLFTSLTNMSPEKTGRNQALLDASRATGATVVQAKFKKNKKYCKEQDRYCKFKEEKGNDVAMAVTMLADAYAGATHRIVLVTADTDQIPAINHIKDRFPEIELSLFIPPGRKGNARDLGALFNSPTEITLGRVEACLLPYEVRAANGDIITIPDDYKKPRPAPEVPPAETT